MLKSDRMNQAEPSAVRQTNRRQGRVAQPLLSTRGMKTILVVDDSHDLANSTSMLLGLLGYKTRTAYNGQEAVNAATEERPDVVLLDLNMPVLDGFQAAREIRSRYPSPPPLIVAVSALAGPPVARRLRESGFDHYLTKPADLPQLLALVGGTA